LLPYRLRIPINLDADIGAHEGADAAAGAVGIGFHGRGVEAAAVERRADFETVPGTEFDAEQAGFAPFKIYAYMRHGSESVSSPL